MTGAVTVRMYNMGFGDAFVVTVDHAGRVWRMLVDCGVHSQGRARPIKDSVAAIIADLTAASSDGHPQLDVVVATHHHADHIVGFAEDAWSQVGVDEVWVPFIEDQADPDAQRIRLGQDDAAAQITALVDAARPQVGRLPATLATAATLADNSAGNAAATDRLLGRGGRGFAAPHQVRYLPSTVAAQNTIATTHPSVTAHILGPSRDPDVLKLMDPPTSAHWLQLANRLGQDRDPAGAAGTRLFNPVYAVADRSGLSDELATATDDLRLDDLDQDGGGLLAAASVLENAVNNTSVFFVLDVAGTSLLFPGDAQEGAWDHVLDDPTAAALVSRVAFVKIAHHGSGNATPHRFIDTVLPDGRMTMLPWGLVERWKTTIPQQNLMAALDAHHHTVIRADAPHAIPGQVTVQDNLWSEITFPLP